MPEGLNLGFHPLKDPAYFERVLDGAGWDKEMTKQFTLLCDTMTPGTWP